MLQHQDQLLETAGLSSEKPTLRINRLTEESYLDLSSDPMNLKPAADVIVKLAAIRYKKALESGRRFVLVMGEQHDRIADKAMQQLVMSRLIDIGLDFTASFEMPSNSLGEVISKDLSAKDKYRLNDLDQFGEATILSDLARIGGGHAVFSRQNVMAFCYYNRIVTKFNDAGMMPLFPKKEQVQYLDRESPDYSEALRKNSLLENLQTRSPTAMSLRNAVMVKRSLQNEGMILHIGGAHHLMGGLKYEYSNSLHRYYSDRNVVVLMVTAEELRPYLSDEGQYFSNNDTLYVGGYSPLLSNVRNGFGFLADMNTERHHLKEIFAQSGGETGVFDWQSSGAAKFFKREFKRTAKALLQQLDVA